MSASITAYGRETFARLANLKRCAVEGPTFIASLAAPTFAAAAGGSVPTRILRSRSDERGLTASPVATHAHAALLASVMRTPEGGFIFNYSADDLIAMKATSVVLADIGSAEVKARAAFFYLVGSAGYYIGGVATNPVERGSGLMTRLLGSEMLRLGDQFGADIQFEMVVRVLRGVPNEKAIRVFRKLGFQSCGVERVRISGSERDRHMLDTAGPDGGRVFAMQMRTDDRWKEAARTALGNRGRFS